MTSSQGRYYLTAASDPQARLLVGDEWRFLAERSVRPTATRRDPSLVAVLGLGIVLGTGGVTPALSTGLTSSSPAFALWVKTLKAAKPFEVVSPGEQIVAIRSLLGLNVVELAAALGVQRPTIYAWQSGTATPHFGNSSRLRRIYQLALRWKRMCNEPMGDWVRRPFDQDGSNLVTLLSTEPINDRRVADAFASVKIRIEEESKEFPDVRETARRFGYRDRPSAKQASSLDRETLP